MCLTFAHSFDRRTHRCGLESKEEDHAIAASIELGEQTISSSQLVVARQSCGGQGNAARLRTTPRGRVCSTERRKHSLAVSVIVRR